MLFREASGVEFEQETKNIFVAGIKREVLNLIRHFNNTVCDK
jgi:hypothetical protein